MKQGFTLMEALVAVLIISILAALLLPALPRAIRMAKETAHWAFVRDTHMGRFADNADYASDYQISHNFWKTYWW